MEKKEVKPPDKEVNLAAIEVFSEQVHTDRLNFISYILTFFFTFLIIDFMLYSSNIQTFVHSTFFGLIIVNIEPFSGLIIVILILTIFFLSLVNRSYHDKVNKIGIMLEAVRQGKEIPKLTKMGKNLKWYSDNK